MTDSEPKRILVVEDERKLAEVLVEYLDRAGYASHILGDGREVEPWIRANPVDLALLDLMLPGRDGMDLCRAIRQFSSLPIIMVTARVEEIDRLLGLELGADDYICKPYSPREVVARVRALFRRIELSNAGRASAAPYTVDRERLSISFEGHAVDLTSVEFRLLAALMERPGKVFSRDQLLGHLYEDRRIVTDRTVDTHVKNIRRKLEQVLPGREVLFSVYGAGYRFEW